MRLLRALEPISLATAPGVVTVGNFDGLHRAHQWLLEQVVREAGATGSRSIAVSFEPAPNRILRPESAPPLITPLPEKIRLFEAAGIDLLLLLPFTRDLSLLTPAEFVDQVLVRGLRMRSIHEGENFRFGHRHQGDTSLLRELGAQVGFAVHIYPPMRMRGEVVSSSAVRAHVLAGHMDRARALLGRPFTIRGRIARGRGIGRQRTVPTLNLEHYDELLPHPGVYLSWTRYRDVAYASLTNVGVRPTFGPGALTVETYLLQPPEEGLDPGSGDEMEISFLRWLRPEIKFETVEALRTAILDDIASARRYFARLEAVSS